MVIPLDRAHNNRLQSTAGVTYDPVGNLASDATAIYTYDPLSQLREKDFSGRGQRKRRGMPSFFAGL
jgi:hypothetical protein